MKLNFAIDVPSLRTSADEFEPFLCADVAARKTPAGVIVVSVLAVTIFGKWEAELPESVIDEITAEAIRRAGF